MLSRKLDDVLDYIKFLRDLIIGPRTPAFVGTAHSADIYGEPALHGLADTATKQDETKDLEDKMVGDDGEEDVQA